MQPLPARTRSQVTGNGVSYVRTSLAALGSRGRGMGQEWGAQGCMGWQLHSPLLAADVMLLHSVAEEGGPGARDDSWLPGVHVESICEPWGGIRREGGRGVSQVEVCTPGVWGPRAGHSPWIVWEEDVPLSMVPAWGRPPSVGRGPAPALGGTFQLGRHRTYP